MLTLTSKLLNDFWQEEKKLRNFYKRQSAAIYSLFFLSKNCFSSNRSDGNEWKDRNRLNCGKAGTTGKKKRPEYRNHGLIIYIDYKGTLRQVFIIVYRLEVQSVMLVFSTQLCELLALSPSLWFNSSPSLCE